MKDIKPKLGIVFFTARWFEEVVLGKDENSKQFNKSLEEDSRRIKEGLAGKVELIDAGVVTSMEKSRKAVNLFFSEDVDAVLLCFAVWSEDEYLLPFRRLMEIVPVNNLPPSNWRLKLIASFQILGDRITYK